MTALVADRSRRQEPWKYRVFTLTSGQKAYKGARACIAPGTGKLVVASAISGLIPIGVFAEQVDATSGDLPVNVDLEREITMERWVNGTAGDAVAQTDMGSIVYILDDQTVSILSSGHSPLGRVWDVDATKGVLVERLNGAGGALPVPAVAAFAANDLAPASVVQDGLYDIPTTGAASTVTLPAASPDGTRVTFAADGTKNGHTVQYRDATGPTNLTTALTASKRHLVIAVKEGGKWFANAYVSP